MAANISSSSPVTLLPVGKCNQLSNFGLCHEPAARHLGGLMEKTALPWSNGPVATNGEALYLRDEETGDVWPHPPAGLANLVELHGAGYHLRA
jgi:hypothetical protein